MRPQRSRHAKLGIYRRTRQPFANCGSGKLVHVLCATISLYSREEARFFLYMPAARFSRAHAPRDEPVGGHVHRDSVSLPLFINRYGCTKILCFMILGVFSRYGYNQLTILDLNFEQLIIIIILFFNVC